MRILLAEDDGLLGSGVRSWLLRETYTVDWVKNGAMALSAIKTEHFDMMLLDINLPKISGIEVLKQVRAAGFTLPIIIISSHNQVACRVQCFELGADDFLVKPFDLVELRARIRAVYRRSTTGKTDDLLQFGSLVLNISERQVTYKGRVVEIPRRELALLQLLMENSNRVVSRQQAIQVVYGWNYDIDSNALEVHVHNLRKLLGNELIKTVRGVGYKLAVETLEQADPQLVTSDHRD